MVAQHSSSSLLASVTLAIYLQKRNTHRRGTFTELQRIDRLWANTNHLRVSGSTNEITTAFLGARAICKRRGTAVDRALAFRSASGWGRDIFLRRAGHLFVLGMMKLSAKGHAKVETS